MTQASDPTPEEPWLREVKEDLDHAAEHLDLSTQMALKRARQQALRQRNNLPIWRRPPVLALASGGLVAVWALNLWSPQTPAPNTPQAQTAGVFEDLPLLMAEDDFELYQSLEFLQWLETQDGAMG